REVPGMRRAVVPEVRAGHALVDELVADRLPGLAAVARALDDLSEPAARLRRVQSVRVGRRSLHVIDLPAAEVRAADVPLLAPAVRGHDERALARTYQHAYSAHSRLLSCSLGHFMAAGFHSPIMRSSGSVNSVSAPIPGTSCSSTWILPPAATIFLRYAARSSTRMYIVMLPGHGSSRSGFTMPPLM